MNKSTGKRPGTLVISLDFELLWGMADVSEASDLAPVMRRVHEVVPRLLKLFETYDIHATWATVGGMMAHDDAEFLRYLPEAVSPQTAQTLRKLGIGQPGGTEKCPREILFVPELVRQVAAAPGQEIGTHTYSHYYCDHADSTPEAFAAEMRAALQIAADNGYDIQTAVFPRNQVGEVYLRAMDSIRPLIFRGAEHGWITNLCKRRPRLGKFVWYADNYLPLQHGSYDCSEILDGGRYDVRNSRFFKPYRPKYRLLEGWKMKRYQLELHCAAKRGEVYHMYWHPHNFAEHTEINFRQMERFLAYYQKQRDRYGMQSRNMSELCRMENPDRV